MKPILSICIPTYNRAEILEKCIQSIVSEKDFLEKIEIAITDNNSTDQTENIVLSYQKKYPNNIRYQKNIAACSADENFIRALNFGTGKFLKLNNDYSFFKTDGLSFLLSIIEKHSKEQSLLLFATGNLLEKKKNQESEIIVNNIDELVNSVSYYLAWISCYGYWKEDWDKLPEKERYCDLHLNVVDWILRLILLKKQCFIYPQSLFDYASLNKKSGSYNLCETFLENYFFILSEYLPSKNISLKTIQKEKKRMFGFLRFWIISLFGKKKAKYSFNTKNTWSILWKFYKNYYRFYFLILEVIYWRILTLFGIYGLLKKLLEFLQKK